MGWRVAGLALGFAVVLAGPVLLFWDAFSSPPWNETTLKAEFQSMRYEGGGLVFRYAVHNLTRRAAHFQPVLTEVRALQASDRPPVGYPNVLLPLDVPAGGSHVVEVRLELPGVMERPADPPAPPTHNPAEGAPPAAASAAEFSVQNALIELNGFLLVDETNGIRLMLPRGW